MQPSPAHEELESQLTVRMLLWHVSGDRQHQADGCGLCTLKQEVLKLESIEMDPKKLEQIKTHIDEALKVHESDLLVMAVTVEDDIVMLKHSYEATAIQVTGLTTQLENVTGQKEKYAQQHHDLLGKLETKESSRTRSCNSGYKLTAISSVYSHM